MKYKTVIEYKEEPHPWSPFIPKNANRLILGTFPTAEINRSAYDFYYPNPNNDFWKVIFGVADKNLKNFLHEDQIKIRKEILFELKMGIADMGKKIFRQKNSSKDDNLFPIEYTDIFSLLDSNSEINKIIITSSSGCNSVLSWFHHYCVLNQITLNIPKRNLPIKTIFLFNNKKIKIEIISSASRLSPIKGDKLFEMYRNAILND